MSEYKTFYFTTGIASTSKIYKALLKDEPLTLQIQKYLYKSYHYARPIWVEPAVCAFQLDSISRLGIASQDPSLLELHGQLSLITDPGLTLGREHFHSAQKLNSLVVGLLCDRKQHVGLITHGAHLLHSGLRPYIGYPTLWFCSDEYNNVSPDDLQHNGFPSQLLDSQALLDELSYSTR